MMRKKEKRQNVFASLIAILLGLIVIFPIIYCVFGAFKTPQEFLKPGLLPSSFKYLDNFRNALSQGNLIQYSVNSFIVAFFGALVRIVLAIMAAYAFTYYNWKGKQFCFFIIIGSMMIPSDVLLATNYLTVSKLNLLNTYFACMVTSFVSGSQVFMLRQSFMSVPKNMREAAQIDGYGDWYFIRKLLIPTCKPVITTLFIQSFINIWNAYLWPLLVTVTDPDKRTVMVGITKLNSFFDENYNLVLAGVCISLIPTIVLFFIARKNMKVQNIDGSV